MADELTELGMSWTDEGVLRAKVAAEVAAASCTEAVEEEEAIRAAWKELQQAEEEMQELETVDEGTMPKARRDYLVRQKVLEIEQKSRKLELAQETAELNRYRRKNSILGNGNGNSPPSGVVGKDGSKQHSASAAVKKEEGGGDGIKREFSQVKKEGSVDSFAGINLAQGRAPLIMPRQGQPGRGAALPGVNPNDVRGGAESNAVLDYRGGAVLPSANRVTANSAEGRSRKRVADDGDLSLYQDRLEAGTGNGPAQEEGGVAPPVAEADGQGQGGGPTPEFVDIQHGVRIPFAVWSKLFDYQQQAVRWMIGLHFKNLGGILGDEMGLGKTVQISAVLSALHSSHLLRHPVLIVCPLTVLSQWISELHKWCPGMRAVLFHASGSSKATKEELIRSVIGTPTVVVTTYMAVIQRIELLHRANFQYVILDEGHKIANPVSGISLAVKTFSTPHRWILSGSPIQNTLKELWSLFDFVVPGLLGSVNSFVDTFEDPIKASRNPRASPLELATAIECAKTLRLHIAPYLLRRLKKDVNAMLPPKHERVIRCSLTDKQLELYTTVLCSQEVQSLILRTQRIKMELGRLDRHGRAADGGLVANARGYMTEGMSHQGFRILSQLRLLTNHADLHEVREEDLAEGGTGKPISFRSNNPVNYHGSGKLEALRKLLVQWKLRGHKVLVFSQFRMMLDIIENMVEQEGYKYIRMDGTTPSKDRGVLISTFNEDDTVFVALMTTKVGGLGVNLTGADRVVIFDPDWNPVTDEQARERAWRIGQKREVCVYRMITGGTVEEHILHRQLAKNYVTEKVLKDPTLQRFFSISSFTEAFQLGSEYGPRLSENVKHLICGSGPSLGHEVEEELERETREAEYGAALDENGQPVQGGNEGGVDAEGTPGPMRAVGNEGDTSVLAQLVDGEGVAVSHLHGVGGRRCGGGNDRHPSS